MSSYTFEKSPVAPDSLEFAIRSSNIVTSLSHITTTPTHVTCWFNADLSSPDQDTLSDIIAAHDGVELPDNEVRTFKPSAFLDPQGYRARLRGTHSAICASGQETLISYTLTEDRIIDGAEYEAFGFTPGDTVSFEVHHPQAGLLDAFCAGWFVTSGAHYYKLYPAHIPAGLQIKVRYLSVGVTPVIFALNLFLHKKE